MMTVTIIAVGKLKEKYLSAAMAEYEKRLSRFCKLRIIEVPDKRIYENASKKQQLDVINREGEAVLEKIGAGQYVIALCIEAPQMSSEEFSHRLSELALSGKSDIVFVIGGSLGLSDKVKERADLHLGFSKMTFPHQLMRVILAEQIYRAFTIARGETYHK